jgi:hypothetical protein
MTNSKSKLKQHTHAEINTALMTFGASVQEMMENIVDSKDCGERYPNYPTATKSAEELVAESKKANAEINAARQSNNKTDASSTASINKGEDNVNNVNTTTTTETNTMKNTTKTATPKLANWTIKEPKAIAGIYAILTFSQWKDKEAIDAVFPFLSEMNEELVLNNTVAFSENNQEFKDFKNAVFGKKYTDHTAYLHERYTTNLGKKSSEEAKIIGDNIRKAANIKLESVAPNPTATAKEAPASNVTSIPVTENKREETVSTNTNTNTEKKTMYTVNDLVLQTDEAYANRIITILNFRDFNDEEALDKTFRWLTSYNSELIHSGESYKSETSSTDRAYRRRVFGEALTKAGEGLNDIYESSCKGSPEPAALTAELQAVLNKMHQAAISKIFHVRKAAESNTQTEVSSTTSINKGEENTPVDTKTVEETPTVQVTPAPVSSGKTETKVKTKSNTKKGQETMTTKQTALSQLKAEQAQAETNSPVNTNNTAKTTMSTEKSNPSILSNVVKATLTVNVTLSNTNMLSEGYIQKMANKNNYITTTRGGAIYADYNDGHDRSWAEVNPIPDATYDNYGNYNCAVWELEYKNGTRQILNHEQSVRFWNFILGDQGGRSVEDYHMKVKVNFPSDITATQTKTWLSETRFRSYSITFNNVDKMFEPRLDSYIAKNKGEAGMVLIPLNADVYFESNTKELARPTLGAAGAHSGMFSDSVKPEFRLADLPGKTKSQTRRPGRIAASKAPVQSPAEVAAPSSVSAPSSEPEVIPAISAEETPATPSTPTQVEAGRSALPAEVEVVKVVEVEAPSESSEPTVTVEEGDAVPTPKKPSKAKLEQQAAEREANAKAAVADVEETPAEKRARISKERKAKAAKSNRAVIDAPSASAPAPEAIYPDAEDMAEFGCYNNNSNDW